MTAQRKRGRPPFLWHGPNGKKFSAAVSVTEYEQRPITKKGAVRLVLRRPEFAHFLKYSMHYLYKQLEDASRFWSPYWKLHKAYKTFPQLPQPRITGTQNELVEHKIEPQLFP
jgi:hypothetical protein